MKDIYSTIRKTVESELKRLRSEVARAESILANLGGSKAPKGKGKKKNTMSAAGRKAIAAAQRARWAKVKAAKGK